MRARKCVLIFVVSFFGLLRPATKTLEIVWLKEVTTRSQTEKRMLSDTNLLNELAFVLRRSSETVSLNLRRNHDINPKADLYFAQKLNDGESALLKSPHWKSENGHIRIGNTANELITAANDAKSRNFIDFTSSLGTKYLSKKQSFTQREDSSDDKGAATLNEEYITNELKSLFRHFERQDKEHQFPPTVYELSTRNSSDFRERESTGDGHPSEISIKDRALLTNANMQSKI
ncbi:hypothetical protein CHS0354_016509 [Potamilus streckersoni]|uniref:Uncharacterized protein n=1 Tax=Potamilus streckersoni TaxID=2493646 RepID=A0AAE0VW19_9BIVA|nr:hypothetical protein CHS0354_016509 [Potamilus streckersoni]